MRGKGSEKVRSMVLWGVIVTSMLGCNHPGGRTDEMPGLAEEYFALSVDPDEWLEIIDGPGPDDSDVRNLRNCAHVAFVPPTRGPWERAENMELAGTRDDRHRSYDRVIRVGDYGEVSARMAYQETPLKEEWVRVFQLDCEGWKQVSTMKTDGEGVVTFRLTRRLPAGVYAVAFQVVGDGSWTGAQVWVLPRQTEVLSVDLFGEFFGNQASGLGGESAGVEEMIAASQAGKAVVYVDSRGGRTGGSEAWRREIIKAGLPMGPVVRGALDEVKSPRIRPERGAAGAGGD